MIEQFYLIHGTLRGTTDPGRSGPGSNDNEGVFYILQSSRTRASPSDTVWCPTQDTRCGGSCTTEEVQSVNFTVPVDRTVDDINSSRQMR